MGLEVGQDLWKKAMVHGRPHGDLLYSLGYISGILKIFTEVKSAYHKISHYRVNISAHFSTFIMLCNHLIGQNIFIAPNKILCLLSSFSLLCSPQPMAITSVYSGFRDFFTVDVSYKWNYVYGDFSFALSFRVKFSKFTLF